MSTLWRLFDGLVVTLELLAVSSACGFAIAALVAAGRLSGRRLFAWPALAYASVLRGTPLLVQIYLVYYGLAQFAAVRHSALWPVLRHAWPCALIAFSANMGAYSSEVMRAAILAVPAGEREAAAALGLSRWQVLRAVTLPRAFRIGLPALVNEVLIQLKATSLASTVTVLDLTGVARRLAAASFTTTPLVEAGLIYAALALAIGGAAHALERALALPGNRPRRLTS
jgi:His/Glu/Gln/Arg/opine family amino acid ABC transporter permease subunit